MERLKRWGVFVLILALLGSGAALLFRDTGSECLSILRTGRGTASFLLAATDAEGKIYVLDRDQDGYTLVLGDQAGNRTDSWRLTAEGLPRESVPAALYPAAGGAVYLVCTTPRRRPVSSSTASPSREPRRSCYSVSPARARTSRHR